MSADYKLLDRPGPRFSSYVSPVVGEGYELAPSYSKPTEQTQNTASGRVRKPTIASRLKSVLPSHRPERGGTLREKGFWKAVEEDQGTVIPKQLPPTPSPTDEPTNGDRLVRWNMAKTIPQRRPASDERHSRPLRPTSANPIARRARHASLVVGGEGANGGNRLPRQQARHSVDLGHTSPPRRPPPANCSRGPGCSVEQRRQASAEKSIVQRIESRRERKILKESGDYLGVQGVNPVTGKLDVITSSSSDDPEQSDPSARTRERFRDLSDKFLLALGGHDDDMDASRYFEQVREIINQHDQRRAARANLRKVQVEREQKSVRWRKYPGQWSSVQETNKSSSRDYSDMADDTDANTAPVNNYEELISLRSPSPARMPPTKGSGAPTSPSRHSNETVVRGARHDTGSEVSQSAQELFENGIDLSQGTEQTRIPFDPEDNSGSVSDEGIPTLKTPLSSSPVSPEREPISQPLPTTPEEGATTIFYTPGNQDEQDFQVGLREEEPRGQLIVEADEKQEGPTPPIETTSVESEISIGQAPDDPTQETVSGLSGTNDHQTKADEVKNENDTSQSESSLRTLVPRHEKTLPEIASPSSPVGLPMSERIVPPRFRGTPGFREQRKAAISLMIPKPRIPSDPQKEAEVRHRLLAKGARDQGTQNRIFQSPEYMDMEDRGGTVKTGAIRTGQNASIPITTTTGYDRLQPNRGAGTRILRRSRWTMISGPDSLQELSITEPRGKSELFNLQSRKWSSPRNQGPQVATHASDTISVREVRPTRERMRKLSARVPATPSTLPMSMFTCLPRKSEEDIWLNEAMREGAARVAVTASLERAKERHSMFFDQSKKTGHFRKRMVSEPVRKLKDESHNASDTVKADDEKQDDDVIEGHSNTLEDGTQDGQDESTQTDHKEPSDEVDDAEGKQVDVAETKEVDDAEGKDGESDSKYSDTGEQEKGDDVNVDGGSETEVKGSSSANEGTTQHTSLEKDTEKQPEAPVIPPEPGTRPIYLVKKMFLLVLAFFEWYLGIIQPCFELDSEWWGRLRREESTWPDLVRGLLALVGIMGLFMAVFSGVDQLRTCLSSHQVREAQFALEME